MTNIEDITYEGEEIVFNGKKHKLLFTNKGMKILAKEFGTVYKALGCMRELNYEFDESSLDKICILLYAGLIHEDNSITIDSVGNMMRFDLMPYFIEKLSKAITGSLPQVTEGNAQSQKEK
jgi:hypothetical protein